MKKQLKIGIIGGGNIGVAIANGIVKANLIPAGNVFISKRNPSVIDSSVSKEVNILSDNVSLVKQVDYIILAVKPYQIEGIANEIRSFVDFDRQILVSVMTGIWMKDMQALFNVDGKFVRAMPNTAASIGESMTCLSFQNVSSEEQIHVNTLFSTLGKCVAIDEQLMDAATVLGACGTAFALRFIRAAIQGGIEIGFDAKVATLIAAQTAKGAADLLLKNNSHPEEEIDKVTTPQGCTIAGLNKMEHEGFSSALIHGVKASYQKIKKEM